MSGPVRPPLTVAESDGTPTIRPCNTIAFNSADFVVIDNGTTARIDLVPGGGGGASLTDTMIGFGDAANLLTGSANLTYTATSGTLLLQDADRATLQIKGTQTSDTTSVGQIAVSNAGDSTAAIAFNRDGANDAMSMRFATQEAGSTSVEERMRITSTGLVGIGTTPLRYSVGATTLHIHDATLPELRLTNAATGTASASGALLQVAGSDFYIWNAEAAKMHFATNAQIVGTFDSAGKLGLGTQTPSYTLDVRAATDDVLANFKSNDANAGIIIDSPDDGYSVVFFAEDGTNKWSLGKTAGASDAFSIYDESNSRAVMQIAANNTVTFNQNNISTADFVIEAQSNSNMFKMDSSQSNIGIGMSPPSGHTGVVPMLTVMGADDAIALLLVNKGTDADHGPEMVMFRDSSSPAVNDLLGRIRFDGEDTGGNPHTYFRMTSQIKDPTDGNEDGNFFFTSREGGALFDVIKFNGAMIEMNPNSAAQVDVWIKGENDNILFADSSQDNLGVGTSAPSSDVERLHVKGTGVDANDPLVRFEVAEDGTAKAPILEFYRNSASPADNDYIGAIHFSGNNVSGTKTEYARVLSQIRDISAATEDAAMFLQVYEMGTPRTIMTLDKAQVVVNENQRNIDFRVESDSNSYMFLVDAGLERVFVGGVGATTDAEFQVNADASFKSYTVNQNTSGIVAAGLQKNGHIVCNPSGGDITVTLGGAGAIGEKVTIMNVAGDASTVLLAVAVGDSTLTTPAAFSSGDSETWFCYKDNNWMRINSQT